jgi:thiol-disulfide isomerase/thioredoxin
MFIENQNYQEIISQNETVMLYFTAEWCGPCKQIAPKIAELADNNPSVAFVKIIADETENAQEIFNEFSVRAVPSFVFIQNGEVVEKVTGSNFSKVQELVTNL